MDNIILNILSGTLPAFLISFITIYAFWKFGRLVSFIPSVLVGVLSLILVYYTNGDNYYDIGFNLFSSTIIGLVLSIIMTFSGVTSGKGVEISEWLKEPTKLLFFFLAASITSIIHSIYKGNGIDFVLIGFSIFAIITIPIFLKKQKEVKNL